MKAYKNFQLSYSSREANSNDTVLDCNINFENPTDEDIAKRLNTWLTAIGKPNITVTYKADAAKQQLLNEEYQRNA
jgi:hypothetical protein